MQRRPYLKYGWEPTLLCPNKECDNISSKLCIVETKIIEGLKDWLKDYEIDYSKCIESIENKKLTIAEQMIKELNKELELQNKKLSNVYDFFEDGTYTKDMFIERSRNITDQITKIKINIEKQEKEIEEEKKKEEDKKIIVPQIKNVIDLYDKLEKAEEKNTLLKTVVKDIKYLKTVKAIKKDSDPTDFEIDIYPKVNKVVQNS